MLLRVKTVCGIFLNKLVSRYSSFGDFMVPSNCSLCRGMEVNFEKGTGPERARTIIVEDKFN